MILGSFFISTWNHASRIRHFTYIRRTRYHTFKILNFSSQFLISHIIFQRFQFFSLLSKLCYQNIKCTSKDLKHRFNVSIFFSLKNKLIYINDTMLQLYRHSKTFKYTKMMPYSFCHKSHMGIKIACMDTIAKIWELKKNYSLLRHGQA